ncbi:MAG TPA: trehalose-6-phosphate synthase [Planctomycetota bacterium]|nr:trehalose-6-phosphate synthase [Planctomycetota bacterium]
MRYVLRFLIPLLLVLMGLAWGTAWFVDRSHSAQLVTDLAARADLLAGSVDAATPEGWSPPDAAVLRAPLQQALQSPGVVIAGATDPTGRIFAAFGGSEFGAELAGVVPHGGPPARLDRQQTLAGQSVLLSVVPVMRGGAPVGAVILAQDLGRAAARRAGLRDATMGAFAALAVLAALATLVSVRFTWSAWTAQMRALLSGRAPAPRDPKLARAMHELIDASLEDRAGRDGGWDPERLRRSLRSQLHGERLVLLANREPYIHVKDRQGQLRVLHPASGLVTALEPVMRACSGTWVAHGSGAADREVVDARDRLRVPPGEESYVLRRVWLSEEEEQGYYYGFANEGLWPLCHIVHTAPIFRGSDWRTYRDVNRRFAHAVCEEADGEDPIVLVQDYHYALAPRQIRQRLPRATVLSFWHIPWPHAERLAICPWHVEVLTGLLGSSIVGFHTQQHCNNFIDSVDRFLEARIDREEGAVWFRGRRTLVRAYPISIEWPSRVAQAAPPREECRARVLSELGLRADVLLGVGVDRVDYTKGLEERVLAVEELLQQRPEFRGRFTFVQLAAPSRTAIPAYKDLNQRLEEAAARVNAALGTAEWKPFILLREHHEPDVVMRYYRAADVCYVSSLHDGMNLVAKEFVAARDDLHGVLVLSSFTGAARDLKEALLVNPYDIEEAASALGRALDMPPEEQARRMRALRAQVAEFNVYRWAGRLVHDAAGLRRAERRGTRLAGLEGSVV